MADECVVCGEAVEGKPLYKKLGSGEHNVEVMAALRALQLITLPDSAKNTSYICWDCDEAVVIEYGRHVEELGKHKTVKQSKKQPRPRPKKKKTEMKMKVKVASGPAAANHEGFWVVQQVNPPPPPNEKKQKQKQKQQGVKSQGKSGSDSNSHHSTHCLMCDNSFDNQSRGFQRHPLKKAVNDDMDVAQVMEDLGLARHIDPKMKARRFICNPCYIIIRRNCKNKLLKGTSIEGPPATPVTSHQDPIHRATTEEHAAEIAKLLPPDLVECYKILTSKPSARPDATNANQGRESHSTPLRGDSKLQTTPPRAGTIRELSPHTGMNESVATPPMAGKKPQTPSRNRLSLSRRGSTWSGDSPENTDEEEEEDDGLNLSQDEHGNYFIDVMSPSDEADNSKTGEAGREIQPTSHTPRKKKNVLLPKRFHHHLSGNGMDVQSSPSTHSDGIEGGTPGRGGTKGSPSPSGNQEGLDTRTCNICGISFSGKTPDWWHTLTSHLMGFDSITINMALKVLETQLAHTSEVVRTAQQVCLPCYSMVSAGFRSQVVQRFARQKNLSAAQVDLSRVKVRMLPKEALGSSSLDGQAKKIEQPVSAKDMNGSKKLPVATNEILNGSNRHLHGDFKYGYLEEECYHKRSNRKGQKRKRSAKDETPGRKKRGIVKSSAGNISASSTLGKNPPLMRPDKVHPIMRGELQPRKYKSKIKYRRLVNRLRKHDTRVAKTLHTLGTARKRGRPPKVRLPQQVTGAPQELPVKRPRGRPPKRRSLVERESMHGAGEKIMPEKAEIKEEEVKGEAACKPVVVLKDLKFVLPREAFGGKAVSALRVEGNMTQQQLTDASQQSAHATATTRNCSDDAFLDPVHFDPGANSTPLQCIFNLLSTYHPPEVEVDSDALHSQNMEVVGKAGKGVQVCGQCVVCGCNYMMDHSLWHHLKSYINPPTLMVSTQWVCVSLKIQPAHVPDKEWEIGKVCHQCFRELGQKFQQFVKSKVGESCGLSAEEVDLSEYLITFNQDTLNLEADPKQQSYIHEFEDGGQLLQRILPVVQQFSVDEVVGQGLRQPLQPHQYSVWLLLVLNELRVQVGADLGELGNWLVSLMPTQMYDSNLRPCPTALAAFLLKVTRSPVAMSEKELCDPIPSTVFMVEAPEEVASSNLLPTLETPTSRDWRDDALSVEEDVSDKEDLPWQKFLEHINLDSLINGTAKPIPAHCMTQGLMYAIWQVSRLLAEGDQLVVDWVKQLSPNPLSDSQLQSLVTAIGSLQSHLVSHPEDVHQFEDKIIPLLNSPSTEASTKAYNFRSVSQIHSASANIYSDLGEGSGTSVVKRRSLSLSGDEEWRPHRKRMRGSKSGNSRARRRRTISSSHKPTKSCSDSQEDESLTPTSDPSTAIMPTPLNPTTATSPSSHSTPLYNSPTTTQVTLKHSSPAITTPPLMTLTHSPVTITETYTHSSSNNMEETMSDRPLTSTSTNFKSPHHSPTLQIQATQSYKVTPSSSEDEDSSRKYTLPEEGKLIMPYGIDIEASLKKATHTDTNHQVSPKEHNLVYKDGSIGEEDSTKSLITPSPTKDDEMFGQAEGLKEPLLQDTINKNNCNQSDSEKRDSEHDSEKMDSEHDSEKRDSEQTSAVKRQNRERAEQPTRQHEEMAKDNLIIADYERESEAVQVSSKLFSKVRELESQLEEIKRDNQKLKEDNIKLSSIQSSKEISQSQEQQTNKTIQQIKGQLKDLMCKTEKSQGLKKASTHSSHPTLPSSKHTTMPKHQHTKKSKHGKKFDKNPEHEKERRDHQQRPAETCTDNPDFDEHQTIDSIRPTKVSPSPHTQVQPPNLNSSQLKLKHNDEQTDKTSARKSTDSKIIVDNHKTSTRSHLQSSSRRNSLSSNTKEINMHKSSILETSSHDEKPCEQEDAGASDMKIDENVSLHDSGKRIESNLQVKSPCMEVKSLQEDKPVRPFENSAPQTDKQVNQIHILGCKNRGTQKTPEPVDKKPKPSFEELMNYDIKIRAPK